ncbi:alpha/beta fold hydrolase [Methylobrevis pamukkalensis]|uniref:Lysophospholipase L2 n=1 Tax=Methylobrevis pamukkalensis TaxID=1439726 RepID=A0A1E3H649_9HYPH|nr:alpha/beta hydrolase [Methylobrevis pamukkalensis]ODN70991.1 lysophospholipase L2 [Methylobrevis pamukkalensis]
MDLLDLPYNPMPAGGRVIALQAEDGVRLRAAFWPATVPEPRGTIAIFEGRAEQIEKYYETVGDLRARGFAVAALDWRGQGGSDRLLSAPRRGHIGRFADFQKDIRVFRDEVVLRHGPGPVYVLAHSMGGNVILTHAASGEAGWIERMVLTAPFLDFGRIPMSRGMVTWLAATLVGLGCGRSPIPPVGRGIAVVKTFDDNPLTHDPMRFSRSAQLLADHPHLAIDAPTVGWIHAAVRSMRLFADPRLPERLRTPMLMIGSGADRVVSTAAIEAMAARLKTAGYVHVPAPATRS